MEKTKNQPAISVLIPTFNGEKTLEEFFITLRRQFLQPAEILVADSSSKDHTVAICEKHGAKVLSISQDDFDHGGTRTFLVEQASGDILIFFTQDTILVTRDALELLIGPLLEDDYCACSYGKQLPHTNANWHAAHLREFNYPDESTVKTYADREKFGLKTIFTSNSFAAYRKEHLLKVGCFKNGLIFGEDTCTVGRILEAGYNIAYVSEAMVFHSHNYSILEEFSRSFDIGVLHTSEEWLLNTFGKAEGVGIRYARSAIIRLIQERQILLFMEFIVRTAMKFSGYKLGRIHKKLPSFLPPFFSMNRNWWRKKR